MNPHAQAVVGRPTRYVRAAASNLAFQMTMKDTVTMNGETFGYPVEWFGTVQTAQNQKIGIRNGSFKPLLEDKTC